MLTILLLFRNIYYTVTILDIWIDKNELTYQKLIPSYISEIILCIFVLYHIFVQNNKNPQVSEIRKKFGVRAKSDQLSEFPLEVNAFDENQF